MLTDHFDGSRFFNPDGGANLKSFKQVLRWKLTTWPARWPAHLEPASAPNLTIEVAPRQVAITYVGHDTFLLQLAGGVNLLTDPVWSPRASPFSWIGPRRARPPAIDFERLPPISAVLLSHNHYDHLDLATLKRLTAAHRPRVFAPLGHSRLLARAGVKDLVELDWWQASDFGGYRITLTPAQHWSSRSLGDRNRSLWGGYWIGGGPEVYFSGDTGYNGNLFQDIRRRLGAPDLSLLPIGTYEPRWFMRSQHMNPDDAVRAHLALGSRQSLGMHFATFQLSNEPIDAPIRDLERACQAHGVVAGSFRAPRFGETEVFTSA